MASGLEIHLWYPVAQQGDRDAGLHAGQVT